MSEPIPLRSQIESKDYPLNRLPAIVRDAIVEVQEYVQAPVAMVAGCALTAISTAVQGLASVARDSVLQGPASLAILTTGGSGERKTATDNFFTKGIREWEAAQKEAAKPAMTAFKANSDIWEATLAGYKQAIKTAASKGEPTKELEEKLREHYLFKPQEPRVPRILREDDSPEALGKALMRWPVAAVLSSEAAVIFGSFGMSPDKAMSNMATLNKCWDGGSINRGRSTTDDTDVEGMRVTLGLMVQPGILSEFAGAGGGRARLIGFLARFLTSDPVSTVGDRPYKAPPNGMPALDKFNQRITELLDLPVNVDENGRLSTAMMHLDPEAFKLWEGYHNHVEKKLGKGCELVDVKDVGSKAAENAARLACCLEIFNWHNTRSETICAGNMTAAGELMEWYLNEALRLSNLLDVDPVVVAAENIEAWVINKLKATSEVSMKTADIMQKGPGKYRKNAKDAIQLLVAYNHGTNQLIDGAMHYMPAACLL